MMMELLKKRPPAMRRSRLGWPVAAVALANIFAVWDGDRREGKILSSSSSRSRSRSTEEKQIHYGGTAKERPSILIKGLPAWSAAVPLIRTHCSAAVFLKSGRQSPRTRPAKVATISIDLTTRRDVACNSVFYPDRRCKVTAISRAPT